MTTFYVGQRVRVVSDCVGGATQLIGSEGVVNDLNCTNEGGESGNIGVSIGDEDDWCFPPDCLEPILYDGNKTVEWSECLWQPKRTGVAA